MRIFLKSLALLFFISCTYAMERAYFDYLPAEMVQIISFHVMFPEYYADIYQNRLKLDDSFYTYLQATKPNWEHYYDLCTVSKNFKLAIQQIANIMAKNIYKIFILPLIPEGEKTINSTILMDAGWHKVKNEDDLFEYQLWKPSAYSYSYGDRLICNTASKEFIFDFYYAFDSCDGNPRSYFGIPFSLESQNRYLLEYLFYTASKGNVYVNFLCTCMSFFERDAIRLKSNSVNHLDVKGWLWDCHAAYILKKEMWSSESLFLFITAFLREMERVRKGEVILTKFMKTVLDNIVILIKKVKN